MKALFPTLILMVLALRAEAQVLIYHGTYVGQKSAGGIMPKGQAYFIFNVPDARFTVIHFGKFEGNKRRFVRHDGVFPIWRSTTLGNGKPGYVMGTGSANGDFGQSVLTMRGQNVKLSFKTDVVPMDFPNVFAGLHSSIANQSFGLSFEEARYTLRYSKAASVAVNDDAKTFDAVKEEILRKLDDLAYLP